jgi:hypothetical protein
VSPDPEPEAIGAMVLRVGHLRVYDEASEQAGPCVTIRAVGIKVREGVLIGGVEIDLS